VTSRLRELSRRDAGILAPDMIPLGSVTFLLFGGLLVIAGASGDALARDLELTLDQLGLTGATIMLGIAAGVVASGPVVDRWPRRPAMVGGAALAALGLVTIDSSIGYGRLLGQLALAGFGAGFVETLINAATIERYGERAARPVTLLHTAATLGAVLAPFAVGALNQTSFTGSFRALGLGWAAIAICSAAVPFDAPQRASGVATPLSMRSPALLLLCAATFIYVGVESSLTLFALPWASDGLALDPVRGRRAISALWLGMLLGRLVVASRSKAGMHWIANGSMAASLLLGLALVGGLRQPELLLGALGVLLAGCFPLLVTLTGQRFAEAPGTAVGLVVGIGSVGGFTLPAVTGAIGERLDVTAAMASLVAWCLALAATAVVVQRLQRPTPGAHSQR